MWSARVQVTLHVILGLQQSLCVSQILITAQGQSTGVDVFPGQPDQVILLLVLSHTKNSLTARSGSYLPIVQSSSIG